MMRHRRPEPRDGPTHPSHPPFGRVSWPIKPIVRTRDEVDQTDIGDAMEDNEKITDGRQSRSDRVRFRHLFAQTHELNALLPLRGGGWDAVCWCGWESRRKRFASLALLRHTRHRYEALKKDGEISAYRLAKPMPTRKHRSDIMTQADLDRYGYPHG